MENICKVVFNRLLKNYRVIFFINVVIIDYKYIHNNIKKKIQQNSKPIVFKRIFIVYAF